MNIFSFALCEETFLKKNNQTSYRINQYLKKKKLKQTSPIWKSPYSECWCLSKDILLLRFFCGFAFFALDPPLPPPCRLLLLAGVRDLARG